MYGHDDVLELVSKLENISEDFCFTTHAERELRNQSEYLNSPSTVGPDWSCILDQASRAAKKYKTVSITGHAGSILWLVAHYVSIESEVDIVIDANAHYSITAQAWLNSQPVKFSNNIDDQAVDFCFFVTSDAWSAKDRILKKLADGTKCLVYDRGKWLGDSVPDKGRYFLNSRIWVSHEN